MNRIVEMRNVHKRFGNHSVLTGLNLTVEQGQALGMLGPSGIGKSTVLRLIAGLDNPDSGDIRIASPRIGYVFQEPRLMPWDSALNNVAMPLRAQGVDKHEALTRARYYLKCMELTDFEYAYPNQLSGGMRQRVSLARAFSVTPDILLLDEPFTGLDARLKKSMKKLLEATMKDSKAAIIHVTHDPAELLDRTDRIIRLERQGK